MSESQRGSGWRSDVARTSDMPWRLLKVRIGQLSIPDWTTAIDASLGLCGGPK